MRPVVRQIFQLKITLDGVTPSVWRRVLVPGGYTLDRVHRCIQYAMGWRDCHLHSFDVDGVQYGMPDADDDPDLRDELDVRLDAVAKVGTRIRYTYDYGDWWEHTVDVEDAGPADPDERYPICLDGERACPPEDVGGVFGYAELLAAIRDPRHPEHERFTGWLGGRYDPDVFMAESVTTLLRRLA
jgi:hypothetical protein